MKNILVTGGPVHAHLDAIKIITNGMKGGRMCQLAEELLLYDTQVTYLCAPEAGAQVPRDSRIELRKHTGFEDYRRQVMKLAPSMDGVILGAAVANLIPAKPLLGKFPSHNYKPGDIIPIDFMIAPRVIDEVKMLAPNTHLFGFKLLKGVGHEELIRAAYGVVLDARATAVIANDRDNLSQKFAVTKERGIHPLKEAELALWIWEMLNDQYYSTVSLNRSSRLPDETDKLRSLIACYEPHFLAVETGLIFGTVAVRCETGFVTTGRGKRELGSVVSVESVDHFGRVVHTKNDAKASLNAPLLDKMFENPEVDSIVHYHEQVADLPTYAYAPPGTVRDSLRPNGTSFNIEGHGCMLLHDKGGRRL